MCRLASQLLGMLGNVLGRPRHAWQRPRHAWQRPKHARHAFSQGPRSPTSKKNLPTCCLFLLVIDFKDLEMPPPPFFFLIFMTKSLGLLF